MARHKKRKDNRYIEFVWITDENGNKKRKAIYGYSMPELNAKLAAFNAGSTAPAPIPTVVYPPEVKRVCAHTVASWSLEWLDRFKYDIVPNTRTMYELMIKTHINPVIGHMYLGDVSAEDIETLLGVHKKLGHRRTAQKIHRTLSQIYGKALKLKYIGENPMIDVDKPIYRRPKKRALSSYEISLVHSADFTLKERAFVFTLMYTGVRRGEGLAFNRGDFNMREGIVMVTKTLYYEVNAACLKPFPKSEAGDRDIPIFDVLRPVLAEYMLSLEGDVLFPSSKGDYMSLAVFSRFWNGIKAKLVKAGLKSEGLTPHLFRHTFATMCMRAGIDLKTVQHFLGHASAAFLAELYLHYMEEGGEDAIDRLNAHVFKTVVRRLENGENAL